MVSSKYLKPIALCFVGFIAYPVFLALVPAGLALGITLVITLVVFFVYAPVTRSGLRMPWRTHGERRGYGYRMKGKQSSGAWFVKKE